MCGITGFVGQPAPAVLERMCSIMEHRGPDDWGTKEAPFASIGMRRLSIIDIEGGHQPVQNEDGTVWAVLNGEIYNYVELRERLLGLGHSFRTAGDTETLVHLYEEYGDNFVEHLRGMFGCAILDLSRERLLVARDRIGEKPLYWSRDGGQLWFGSEQKCLLAARGLADVDRGAVADFMGLGYVPGSRTFHSHIEKLLPGQMLVWQQGEAKVQTWFRFAHGAKADLSESEALEGLSQHLDDAARLTLRADVEVGAFLSGGLDSSLVTALARRHQASVKTFSVGYRGAAEGFNELAWAQQVADHLGTEHHELIIEPSSNLEHLPKVLWHFDEPHGEPTSILVHQLSSFVRQHVKVALGGTGGDELFFGYPRYQAVKHLGRWVGLPGGLRRLAKSVVSLVPEAIEGNPLVRRTRRFVSARGDSVEQAYSDWLNLLDASWRSRLLGQPGSDAERMVLERLDGVGPLFDRAAAIDVDMYLPEYQLAYMDRMSMAVGLEVRSPLVDWELAQFALSLPADYRFKAGRTKHLLKEAARGLIGQDIIDRKKVGFDSPIGNWLRGELRGFATAFLAPEQIARTGLLAPDGVAALLGEHLAGKADHSMQLWAVLAVEAWYRMTFEGAGVTTAPPDLADLRGAPTAA